MTIFINVANVYVSTYIAAYCTTVSSTPSIKAPYLPRQSPAEAVYANSHLIVLKTIC